MSSIFMKNNTPNAPMIPDPPLSALIHVPGGDGWPLVGHTLQLLADPKGSVERLARAYGPVHRTYAFGGRTISLLGPDANEFVLLDQARAFSSKHGWSRILQLLFPGGLLLFDFEEHRLQRKALSVAFKAGPMRSYLRRFDRGIAQGMAEWTKTSAELRFYPAMKKLTLNLAAACLLGAEIGPELDEVRNAFIQMIAASVAVVRYPIPGTQMHRGVRGRRFMIDYFSRQIAARRSGDGEDIFTQLCKTTTEDGALLSPQEIIDHMNFLMMAAHDTLASSLTSFVYFIAANPSWQAKLRAEVLALGLDKGEPLPYERLNELKLIEMAFNESLRLIPPAPSLLRCAVRDTEFGGFRIPRGARVNIDPLYTHHMPDVWPEPEQFDPLRFTEAATRNRHRYAFVPFGGGAHMCLGLNFAYLQAKCFAYHLLANYDVTIHPRCKRNWSYWPIPRPRDGLPVRLTTRN